MRHWSWIPTRLLVLAATGAALRHPTGHRLKITQGGAAPKGDSTSFQVYTVKTRFSTASRTGRRSGAGGSPRPAARP